MTRISEKSVCQMSTELILRHDNAGELERDFEANLRKGRAFVPGPSSLGERDYCTLRIEPPSGGEPFHVRAEAVWIDAAQGGTGLSFVDVDAGTLDALRAFVARAKDAESRVVSEPTSDPPRELGGEIEPDADTGPAARNLHDRVRALEPSERDVMARHGNLPERVALERCHGGSVWEGLLHNPQLTAREVLRMAKSTSLPGTLINLLVANRAWLADGAIHHALLQNPRLSGVHLERVLKPLPPSDLARMAEQSGLRVQVRQAAQRLIRR
jgi:hypothetical protein